MDGSTTQKEEVPRLPCLTWHSTNHGGRRPPTTWGVTIRRSGVISTNMGGWGVKTGKAQRRFTRRKTFRKRLHWHQLLRAAKTCLERIDSGCKLSSTSFSCSSCFCDSAESLFCSQVLFLRLEIKNIYIWTRFITFRQAAGFRTAFDLSQVSQMLLSKKGVQPEKHTATTCSAKSDLRRHFHDTNQRKSLHFTKTTLCVRARQSALKHQCHETNVCPGRPSSHSRCRYLFGQQQLVMKLSSRLVRTSYLKTKTNRSGTVTSFASVTTSRAKKQNLSGNFWKTCARQHFPLPFDAMTRTPFMRGVDSHAAVAR